MSSILDWLQQWFVLQCDDEWEHSKGILIDTLDNPGWRVRIDVTKVEGRSDEVILDDRNGDDWVLCRIEGEMFNGYGAATSLQRILSEFKSYIERHEGVAGTQQANIEARSSEMLDSDDNSRIP